MVLGCLFGKPHSLPKDAAATSAKTASAQDEQRRTASQEQLEQVQRVNARLRSELDDAVKQVEQLQQERVQLQREKDELLLRKQEELDSQKASAAIQVEQLSSELQQERRGAAAKQSEHDAKVQALELRVSRHQRERAKLLDQIQRRDKALVLARQVIDMVDRTGVLDGLSLGGPAEPAPAPPTAPGTLPPAAPRPPLATHGNSSSKGAATVDDGGDDCAADANPTSTTGAVPAQREVSTSTLRMRKIALDELRRSLPAMKAVLVSATLQSVPAEDTGVVGGALPPAPGTASPLPSLSAVSPQQHHRYQHLQQSPPPATATTMRASPEEQRQRRLPGPATSQGSTATAFLARTHQASSEPAAAEGDGGNQGEVLEGCCLEPASSVGSGGLNPLCEASAAINVRGPSSSSRTPAVGTAKAIRHATGDSRASFSLFSPAKA